MKRISHPHEAMKVVNVILGLATAIILSALINLGIKAFYPEPVAPSYPSPQPAKTLPEGVSCAPTDKPCLAGQAQEAHLQQAAQDQFTIADQAYEAEVQIYDSNLFVIANLIGILIFALGFWLVFASAMVARGVPIGIMVAGLWSIIYGYARGWDSTDDQLKFLLGLVIAVIVIGGSAWLMQKKAARS